MGRKGGVVVDWSHDFKISDLSAPARAARDPGGGQSKKMTGYKLGTSAPTQINLPHNSFVRPPPKRDVEADAVRERYKSLREACRSGDSKAIRKLVEGGCDVNYDKLDNYAFTPLHHAAWKGRTDAVTMLLALGARPDPCNKDLKTPLHLAASNGKASTVRALVRGGAG
eukprot:CAMPEP_0174926600 /NCGR_PEP_ID=MMETSP1355-20121228/12529_1 /TAXON_ID=464990 /ORGANISM="Hemiselmis tepida, Strain CCMP443" /LENGTH=168 /DNA_ID=CAMNT_0016172643 /DNA_START=24 /DNA_END=527 /DNA_ORIENTATION=-